MIECPRLREWIGHLACKGGRLPERSVHFRSTKGRRHEADHTRHAGHDPSLPAPPRCLAPPVQWPARATRSQQPSLPDRDTIELNWTTVRVLRAAVEGPRGASALPRPVRAHQAPRERHCLPLGHRPRGHRFGGRAGWPHRPLESHCPAVQGLSTPPPASPGQMPLPSTHRAAPPGPEPGDTGLPLRREQRLPLPGRRREA